MPRAFTERRPDFGDEHGQACVGDECRRPEPLMQFGFREGAGSVDEQSEQQLKRFRRQMDRDSIAQELPRAIVHEKVAEP